MRRELWGGDYKGGGEGGVGWLVECLPGVPEREKKMARRARPPLRNSTGVQLFVLEREREKKRISSTATWSIFQPVEGLCSESWGGFF